LRSTVISHLYSLHYRHHPDQRSFPTRRSSDLNALRDYFRDIGRMVLAAEGRKANDSHADCYQYFCVPEYGTANGRLHFHATLGDRKSGSAGMPRPISYAVFCVKKKTTTSPQHCVCTWLHFRS